MNDKDILKYLALQLLIYAVQVVLAMVILLGGLWIIGWTVELIAEYIPFPITLIVGVTLIVLTLALPYMGKPKKRRIRGYRSTMERR